MFGSQTKPFIFRFVFFFFVDCSVHFSLSFRFEPSMGSARARARTRVVYLVHTAQWWRGDGVGVGGDGADIGALMPSICVSDYIALMRVLTIESACIRYLLKFQYACDCARLPMDSRRTRCFTCLRWQAKF